MARLGSFFINRGMRNATPKHLHERVITVYGSADQWKKRVGFSDKASDVAHLVLIDGAGRVRWLHNGGFDQESFEELRKVTEALLVPAGSGGEQR